MTLDLSWMRPDAPYMPIATVGLLSVLADAGNSAAATWREGPFGPTLQIETDLAAKQVAEAIIGSPWPDVESIPWSTKLGQAINPMLAEAELPVAELQRLRRETAKAGLTAELRLLNALVTEAVLIYKKGKVHLGRNHLLRGVKADLSGVRENVKLDADLLAAELSNGLNWRPGKSGRGLGLTPEVQTFGGTTGPEPSDVGSESALLYRLLWMGVLALPPVGVVQRGRRIVGGPLVTDAGRISWPTWSIPLGLEELRAFYCLSEIHEDKPDMSLLRQRGIARIYRSEAIPISTTGAVFRWGERIA